MAKKHPLFSDVDFRGLLNKKISAPWKPSLKNKVDTKYFDLYDEENDSSSLGEDYGEIFKNFQ